MSTPRAGLALASLALVAVGCAVVAPAPTGGQRYGLGTPLDERVLAGWNIDVAPDGAGLPPGRGNVAQGRTVYESKCVSCHGEKGVGGPANRLAGGSVKSRPQVKTVGSFWPHATTIYDYVNRAMPWDRPQSLAPDEVYAVTAYLLFINGIVPESATLDAVSLPRVRMPNRDGFNPVDPRPDTR